MRTARLIRAEQEVLAAARLALSAEARSITVWVAWVRSAQELRAAEHEAYGLTDTPPEEPPTVRDVNRAHEKPGSIA